MGDFPTEKREIIISLIKQQKKAKINWVATICQVSADDLVLYASNLGLLIEEDYLLFPEEAKGEKEFQRYERRKTQLIADIIQRMSFKTKTKTGVLLEGIINEDGTVSVYTLVEAHKILNEMKQQLQNTPIEHLRVLTTISRYLELIEIPLQKSSLQEFDIKTKLAQAKNLDALIREKALASARKMVLGEEIIRSDKHSYTLYRVKATDGRTIEIIDEINAFLNVMSEFFSRQLRAIHYEAEYDYLTEKRIKMPKSKDSSFQEPSKIESSSFKKQQSREESYCETIRTPITVKSGLYGFLRGNKLVKPLLLPHSISSYGIGAGWLFLISLAVLIIHVIILVNFLDKPKLKIYCIVIIVLFGLTAIRSFYLGLKVALKTKITFYKKKFILESIHDTIEIYWADLQYFKTSPVEIVSVSSGGVIPRRTTTRTKISLIIEFLTDWGLIVIDFYIFGAKAETIKEILFYFKGSLLEDEI